jgi:ubiquinone/menaquinone biosynthesis C-methylase UbiE
MRGVEQQPALYDRLMQPMDRTILGYWRRHLFSELAGDILELGAGTGLNFAAYGPQARITAIEIDPQMIVAARSRAESVQLVLADAQRLPFHTAMFDYVTSALVFCTIPDPAQALHEVARVLRPGGRLIQLEHTRTNHPLPDAALTFIAPAWKVVAGGCVLDRDTPALLEKAGWRLLRHQRQAYGLIRLIEALPPAYDVS